MKVALGPSAQRHPADGDPGTPVRGAPGIRADGCRSGWEQAGAGAGRAGGPGGGRRRRGPVGVCGADWAWPRGRR